MAELKTKTVAIDSIRPDPRNVREHSERSRAAIRATLQEFGQQKPIVVDRAGVIVAGNGTWAEAKALGWTRIAVVVTDLEGKKAAAFAIADNRVGELSNFDGDALAAVLREIDDPDLLAATGFDDGDIADIFGDPPELAELGDADAPTGEKATRAVAVKVVVAVKAVDVVERALAATELVNREAALLAVCQAYLDAKGQQHAGL